MTAAAAATSSSFADAPMARDHAPDQSTPSSLLSDAKATAGSYVNSAAEFL